MTLQDSWNDLQFGMEGVTNITKALQTETEDQYATQWLSIVHPVCQGNRPVNEFIEAYASNICIFIA